MGDKNNKTTGGNSTEIDTLSLNIEVTGADSGKNVESLATAISRLNKVLKGFNDEKFSNFLDTMKTKFDPFLTKVGEVSKALESLSTIVQKTSLSSAVKEVQKLQGGLPEIKTEQAEAGGGEEKQIQFRSAITPERLKEIQQMTSVNDVLRNQLTQIQEKMKNQNLSEEQLLKLKKQELKLTEQIAKADKGGDDGKKTEKKATAFGKLVKSFGRIAMYRAIRTVIKEITQAFTESIDGIARYNSEFRDTMGSLQSSMAKLKTSIGVGLYQVLIVLEPVITAISNGIVNLANSLSKVTANLRGVAEYTKINTDYMKDYQSATQGALLSFDTFTTLNSNQGIDYSQMLDTGTDALDESNFTDTENSLKRIFELIQTIGETAQKVWNGGLKNIISTILDIVIDVVSWVAKGIDYLANLDLGKISALEAILWGIVGVLTVVAIKNLIVAATNPFTFIALGIAAVVAAIAVLIANWDEVVDFFKTTCEKIGNFFTDLWDGIVDGVKELPKRMTNAIKEGIKDFGKTVKNKIKSILGFEDGGMMTTNTNGSMLTTYANGGRFEGAGTMYAIAGESGAEIVAQGSQGTGVANVEQIAEAQYRGTLRALYEYGVAQNTVVAASNISRYAAQDVYDNVSAEMNRRNSKMNIR